MSLHFLLDGYNILHRVQGLPSGTLEDKRKFLMRLIETNRLQGSAKNSVTIVFDGHKAMTPCEQEGVIKAIFSGQESADDRIKTIVRDSEYKKSIIVVTDDRNVQYFVRALGAKIMPVEEFMMKTSNVKKISKKTGAAAGETHKNISSTLQSKITSEFEKIWLDKNK